MQALQGCRSRGCHPHILTDQLTLSQPGGQIIPTTLLLAPAPPRIVRLPYGPALHSLELRNTHNLRASNNKNKLSTQRKTQRDKCIYEVSFRSY